MPFWTKQEKSVSGGGTQAPTPRSIPHEEERMPMAMLKRDELPTSLGGSSDLLLGRGAEFDGKLNFEGTVRMDAKFTGSITTNDVLVVGENARINAEISCGTIIVHGEVNGNIKAKIAVELHHPAKVHGNIETPSLTIEKGVVFHGESRMAPAEKAAASRPATTPNASANGSAPHVQPSHAVAAVK